MIEEDLEPETFDDEGDSTAEPTAGDEPADPRVPLSRHRTRNPNRTENRCLCRSLNRSLCRS